MTEELVFTSDSVTAGHPDKLCDQISDAIVDHFLRADPRARITAESAVAKGILFLALRYASDANIEVGAVAREVIARTGYTQGGFQADTCSIMTSLVPVAPPRPEVEEAELGGDEFDLLRAEHNVTSFGYACKQSPGYLPLPIWLAHKLARRLTEVREDGSLGYLAPDGQVQVAITFRDRQPRRIHGITLVSATDGSGAPKLGVMREELTEHVIRYGLAEEEIKPDDDTAIFVNPHGAYLVGGPEAHAGLTGRKTAIDTYGEYAHHSGAALSGKDPGRIDRIGAYAARHAAKNVVAAGLAEECEIQLSYAIGQARPVSMHLETFGSEKLDRDKLRRRVAEVFDFRPAAIIAGFDLRNLPRKANGPFYERLAAYGQMGRLDVNAPWEQLDRVAALQEG